MRRPQPSGRDRGPRVAVRTCDGVEIRESYGDGRQRYRDITLENIHGNYIGTGVPTGPEDILDHEANRHGDTLPSSVMQAMIGVNFIADHLRQQDEFNKVNTTLLFCQLPH